MAKYKKKTISNRICWFKIEQGLDSISKKIHN